MGKNRFFFIKVFLNESFFGKVCPKKNGIGFFFYFFLNKKEILFFFNNLMRFPFKWFCFRKGKISREEIHFYGLGKNL